jgi:hypothetical protein
MLLFSEAVNQLLLVIAADVLHMVGSIWRFF